MRVFRLVRYVGLDRAKSLIIRGNMIDVDTAFEEFEDWLVEYAATNSAGCRASKQMLLDCFDLGWETFFHKYLVLQEKAMAAPDFAEAMEACRACRDPQWG